MEDAISLHHEVDYFYEDWATRLRRLTMGTAYALRPNRWATLPHVLGLSAGHLLKSADARMRFPATINPRSNAGLVGLCDDLSVPTLVRAYSQGIFPFCHLGPMKWWSPSERSVLLFENERIEDSTRKLLRKRTFKLTFDYAFAGVIEACSKPRARKTPLTWITPRVMDAYLALHQAGYAHSIEVWDSKDKLVGGIYGVAVGDVFFGESQFSTVPNASKVASAVLNAHLRTWGFALRDTRFMTEHHARAGCVSVPRRAFNALVQKHVRKPSRSDLWEVDENLDVASWKPKRLSTS